MFKSTSLENSNGCGELQSRDKSLLCSAASASNRIQECLLRGAAWGFCGGVLAGSCRAAPAGSRWQTSNPSSGWTSGCSFLSSCFSLVLQLLKRKVPVPLILSRIAVLAHWLRHLVTAILWITKDINVEGVLLFSYTPPGTKQGVTWIKKKKKINPRLFSPSGGTEVMSTAK